MEDRSERASQPLPRGWLPDPQPREGSPEWEATVERIMSAAEPELRRIGSPPAPAWSVMARWRKPAAVLVAAAMALLFLTERPARLPEPQQGSVPLSLIAGEGDPVSLWEAFGVQADTVLALIAVRAQEDAARQEHSEGTAGEDNR